MKTVSIIAIKMWKRLRSALKKFVWKLLYGKDFKCGVGTHFYPYCHVVIENHGKILIGNNCFFNNNCSLNSMDEICIGNNCIFGENVCFYDHNHQHEINDIPFLKQGYCVGKIVIGDNCWFGSDVIVLQGVNIGNNVVVGAGVVVSKSIPDNSLIVDQGNIRKRELGGTIEYENTY